MIILILLLARCEVDQVKEVEWAGHVTREKEGKVCAWCLVGKNEGEGVADLVYIEQIQKRCYRNGMVFFGFM
jgi:hypothetical protein